MKLNERQIKELLKNKKITKHQATILETKHIEDEDSLVDLGINIAVAAIIFSSLSNDGEDATFSTHDDFSGAFQGGQSGGGGAERDFSSPEDVVVTTPPMDSGSEPIVESVIEAASLLSESSSSESFESNSNDSFDSSPSGDCGD